LSFTRCLSSRFEGLCSFQYAAPKFCKLTDMLVFSVKLQPENLLLDQNGELKISDFGLSALYTGTADDSGRATLLHTTCGTPNYVAPEVLNDKGYDGRAADIWSCGVILYVLLAGFLPFDEPHMAALFRKIQKAEFTYPSWFTPPVRALLDKILIADPLKRAKLQDIELDPWFVGPDGLGIKGADEPAPGYAKRSSDVAQTSVVTHDSGAGDDDGVIDEIDDDEEAHASEPKKKEASGPTVLNAFELINMFNGMALNRIMESTDKRAASQPQFLSSQPLPTILSRIMGSLQSMGAAVSVDEASYKLKGRVVTGKGEIAIVVVIYRVSDSLHLVEVYRGKGDILEYNRVYTALREATADLVSKTSSARLKL
jgi:serine/threonine protein kinase